VKDGFNDAATKGKQMTETVAEKTKTFAGEAKDVMSDAKSYGQAGIREGEQSAKSALETVADTASELACGARTFAERAVEKSQEGYRQLAEQTEGGIRVAGELIRANPEYVVTFAFAIGIGVGLLIGFAPRPRSERSWFTR